MGNFLAAFMGRTDPERAGGSLMYPRPCLPERMRAADQFAPTRRGNRGRARRRVGTGGRRIAVAHLPTKPSQTQTSQNVYVIRIRGVTVLTGEKSLCGYGRWAKE